MSKKELVNDYIDECSPLLDTIVENVFLISAAEEIDGESIDLIFRAFHTIKSNSSIIEESSLVEVCHICEDALFEVRDKKKALTPTLVSSLMMAIEFLNDSFIRLDSDVELEPIESRILFKLAEFIES
jgi:two-component system chemotaxis sensor kinase CheA